MIPRARWKLWAWVTSVTLALSSVVGVPFVREEAANALSGSRFDPGLIIGDSVFYDFGATTADQIQRFLDDKVPKCKLASDAAFTCLRYFKTDIPAMPAVDGRCDAIEPATNQSVAQMLIIIGKACNINPRVLLVTLQKEQGLVTSTNPIWPDPNNPGQPNPSKPLDYRYRIAMGYSCTDSGPCTTFGFFWQVYKAAGQFHWYGNPNGSFTYLKVGKNVSILYQANKASCGSRTFQLKSQATAALYYYTPYTPNKAALDNLYGTGDSCSAYGNRNFWRYYWDWFGSPIGGGFLLQSDTSGTYLIVDDPATNTYEKHLLTQELVTSFAPLGPVGVVSQAYLDGFTSASDMTPLVKSSAGNYFFIDGGKRYQLDGCAEAEQIGLDCTKAVQLTANQFSALPASGNMTVLVPDDPTQADGPDYIIQEGVIHEILDDASVLEAGLSLPVRSPVGIKAFSYLPFGAPIAANNTLVRNRTSGDYGLILENHYFKLAAKTADDIDFKSWYPLSAGSLSTAGLAPIDSGVTVQTIVASTAGDQWVLEPAGKQPVSATALLTNAPAVLPDSLLTRIPTIGASIAAPVLAKSPAGKTTYLLTTDSRRTVHDGKAVTGLLPSMTNAAVLDLPASAITQLTLKGPVWAPATLLQSSTGAYFATDDLTGLRPISGLDVAKLYGLGTAIKAGKNDLAAYSKLAAWKGAKILCGTQQYLPVGGKWQPIADDYVKAYPGIAVALATNTCARLKLGSTALGRFVISPAKLTYLVSGGKRRLVANAKQYAALRGTTPVAFKIDATLNAMLPLGTPMKAGDLTAIPVAGTGNPTPTPTPTATPTATPTPTPKPTVIPSPTPTPTPTKIVVKYTVVAGDTLSKIAAKYGVTVTALKAKNNLTSDTIKVGQVLTIP